MFFFFVTLEANLLMGGGHLRSWTFASAEEPSMRCQPLSPVYSVFEESHVKRTHQESQFYTLQNREWNVMPARS